MTTIVVLLETLGTTARAAYDWPSGVVAVGEFKPDIVFIDIGMPGVDGHETARRIRQGGHPHRPILVALTGWAQKETRCRSRKAGCDAHLTKPATVEEVEAVLRLARP